MIFSSGVDRKAMRYQRHSNGKWAHIDGRTYHKHDVRAMTSFESAQIRMILSGGSSHIFCNTDAQALMEVFPVYRLWILRSTCGLWRRLLNNLWLNLRRRQDSCLVGQTIKSKYGESKKLVKQNSKVKIASRNDTSWRWNST